MGVVYYCSTKRFILQTVVWIALKKREWKKWTIIDEKPLVKSQLADMPLKQREQIYPTNRALFTWISQVIRLLWFGLKTLIHWFKNLPPLSRPIRSKSKTKLHALAKSRELNCHLKLAAVHARSSALLTISSF